MENCVFKPNSTYFYTYSTYKLILHPKSNAKVMVRNGGLLKLGKLYFKWDKIEKK